MATILKSNICRSFIPGFLTELLPIAAIAMRDLKHKAVLFAPFHVPRSDLDPDTQHVAGILAMEDPADRSNLAHKVPLENGMIHG